MSSRGQKDSKVVEVSPDGRYERFDERLGSGAYKDVWLAYDTETGKEVAWNTVEIRKLPAAEKKRIRLETEILAQLVHPHIINFYHVWENVQDEQICFTTEIMTSGTLKQYIKSKVIKLKVIKKWSRQILTGLQYLHSHVPPIIHRDLKCDNIFINGSTGEIRIGDFGLSSMRDTEKAQSVLGTPEFMAPELYEEHYDEKVDIYAFGMCILEMVSKEYPYEECNNAAQIWKRVSQGIMPDVLQRIKEPTVRAFVEVCLAPAANRLSARELLDHPFLRFRRCDPVRDNVMVTVEPKPVQPEGNPLGGRGVLGGEHKRNGSVSPSKKAPVAQSNMLYGDGTGHASSVAPTPTNQQQPTRNPAHNITRQSLVTGGRPHVNASINTSEHQQYSATSSLLSPQSGRIPTAHHHPHNIASHPPPNSQTPTPSHHMQYSASNNTLASMTSPTSQTPTAHLHQAPPATASDWQSLNTVVDATVEVELPASENQTPAHQCDVQLVIYFEPSNTTLNADGSKTRRRKAIRFVFDFLTDTCHGVAAEMVKALKLPDPDRTHLFLTHRLREKLDPYRQIYYQHYPEQSNNHMSYAGHPLQHAAVPHNMHSFQMAMMSPPATMRQMSEANLFPHQMPTQQSTPAPLNVADQLPTVQMQANTGSPQSVILQAPPHVQQQQAHAHGLPPRPQPHHPTTTSHPVPTTTSPPARADGVRAQPTSPRRRTSTDEVSSAAHAKPAAPVQLSEADIAALCEHYKVMTVAALKEKIRAEGGTDEMLKGLPEKKDFIDMLINMQTANNHLPASIMARPAATTSPQKAPAAALAQPSRPGSTKPTPISSPSSAVRTAIPPTLRQTSLNASRPHSPSAIVINSTGKTAAVRHPSLADLESACITSLLSSNRNGVAGLASPPPSGMGYHHQHTQSVPSINYLVSPSSNPLSPQTPHSAHPLSQSYDTAMLAELQQQQRQQQQQQASDSNLVAPQPRHRAANSAPLDASAAELTRHDENLESLTSPASAPIAHVQQRSHNVAFVDGIPSAVLRDSLNISQSFNDLGLLQRVESAPTATPPRNKSAGSTPISNINDLPLDLDPLLYSAGKHLNVPARQSSTESKQQSAFPGLSPLIRASAPTSNRQSSTESFVLDQQQQQPPTFSRKPSRTDTQHANSLDFSELKWNDQSANAGKHAASSIESVLSPNAHLRAQTAFVGPTDDISAFDPYGSAVDEKPKLQQAASVTITPESPHRTRASRANTQPAQPTSSNDNNGLM